MICILISILMDNSDQFQKQPQAKPTQSIFIQEQIRGSSSSSSNNQESKNSKFQQLDSIMQPLSKIYENNDYQGHNQQKIQRNNSQVLSQELVDKSQIGGNSIIMQVQKNWIMKQAQIQRIGGTYNYFTSFLQIYQRNLISRKTILDNINSMVDKNKITKALPIMMLNQYFKEYSAIAKDFQQKGTDFQVNARLEYKKKQVNMHAQLKEGFNLLVNLRKTTAHQMSRLQKYMANTTHKKINAALDKYWGLMAGHQAKANNKKSQFQDKHHKFHKRIDKLSKLYNRGMKGEQVSEDYFQEMCKLIRQQRQLRYSIYDWGIELLNLRQHIIAQDLTLFNELELILTQFKNLNNTVFQLQKKKFNFLVDLKQDIQKKYLFEVLCTPLDNDYIISVLNYKNKLSIKNLQQDEYEHFIKEEYFSQVVGDPLQLLKGTIAKYFPLKNEQQQLIKTVSGNLIHYNKKSLQIKYKMKQVNVKGEFEGNGCIFLKQKIRGIFYDSDNVQKVYFKDDNRAQQLILFLSGQFDCQQ